MMRFMDNTATKPRDLSRRTILPRLFFIDSQIASGAYPSTKQLAAEYECGTATICRDIEFMRDRLNAPIEYSAQHRGFYYEKKTFRLSAAFVGPDEIMALAVAKNILALCRDTPLYESIGKVLDAVTQPLAQSAPPGDRIVAPLPASYPVSAELWNTITAGLRENRILSFEYQSVWDKPFETRVVHPYQLLFDGGVWYLYGYAEERQGRRMFSLSRIRGISLSGRRFNLPKDFDYRAKQAGSYFGVFAGEKRQHFRVKFTGDFVLWAKERKWAADQKSEDTPDGVILDFTSTQHGKVLEWVLSKGSHAEPLAPPELVAAWRAQVAEMAANVGNL
jgi:predicted DNA-binding transcriptional regulator YafY